MMSSSSSVPLGRHLLDRRGFLGHMARCGRNRLLGDAGRHGAARGRPPMRRTDRWRRNPRIFRPGPSGSCTSSAPARSAISIPGTTSPS